VKKDIQNDRILKKLNEMSKRVEVEARQAEDDSRTKGKELKIITQEI
jgi:hypothetical protein